MIAYSTVIGTQNTSDETRPMRVVKLLALAATLGVAAENASAQEGALSRLYGNGIHAYFGGDISGAEKLFTQAIDAGSQDPRCHYYRGLIYLQAGRKQAAAAEFDKGADLEAGSTRAYDVSMSLERVQGRARITLEQHRAAKLATATSATQVQRRQRLESIQRREPVTTVPRSPNRLDVITGDAAPVPATEPEVSQPFADPMDAAPPAAAAAKTAAPPAAAPVTEEAADPFGADDALPADDMPAADPVPTDNSAPDPVEAPADDEASDPFGGDEAPAVDAAADEEMPADDAAPAEEESDPFGADDAAPAADDTAPATDDAAPAEEAADEADPFGGDDAAADDSSAEAPADDAAPADEAPADEEDPFGSE
jgi:tetratricopeptide (TPR) repeat protein